MNKIICVDNENELRLLFSSTNTDVKDGDQILIKKNITLSEVNPTRGANIKSICKFIIRWIRSAHLR